MIKITNDVFLKEINFLVIYIDDLVIGESKLIFRCVELRLYTPLYLHKRDSIKRGEKHMYCKYCGKELNEDALFCSGCGKKVQDDFEQSKNVSKSVKKHKWVFPVTVLLYLLCSNITGELISWLFAGIGLITVIVLCFTKLVKPEKIGTEALCIPFVVLFLEGLRLFGFWIIENFAETFMGQYGSISSSFALAMFPDIENTYGANTLWLWMLFIMFLLLQSQTIKHKKIYYLIAGAGLIIWSMILAFLIPGSVLAMQEGLPQEVIYYVESAYSSYFIWMFIRRFVFYCLMTFAGRRRIGAVGMIVSAMLIIGGCIILVPICFSYLSLGMKSVSALSFGYLFSILILLIALIREKKIIEKEEM